MTGLIVVLLGIGSLAATIGLVIGIASLVGGAWAAAIVLSLVASLAFYGASKG